MSLISSPRIKAGAVTFVAVPHGVMEAPRLETYESAMIEPEMQPIREWTALRQS